MENLWITCGKLDHGTETAAEKNKISSRLFIFKNPK
nr:MAG TPA: hypothetical protein [Caudoviricetes sp.]